MEGIRDFLLSGIEGLLILNSNDGSGNLIGALAIYGINIGLLTITMGNVIF